MLVVICTQEVPDIENCIVKIRSKVNVTKMMTFRLVLVSMLIGNKNEKADERSQSTVNS